MVWGDGGGDPASYPVSPGATQSGKRAKRNAVFVQRPDLRPPEPLRHRVGAGTYVGLHGRHPRSPPAPGKWDNRLAEVVLRELARQPLEAHHHRRGAWSQLGDQLVECRVAAIVAVQACSAEYLHRLQRRRVLVHLLQEFLDQGAASGDLARPSDAALRSFALIIDVLDSRLAGDRTGASRKHPGRAGVALRLPNQTLPKTVSTRTDEAIGRLERIIERREQEGAREREEAARDREEMKRQARRDREGARPALRTLTDGMAILVAVDTPF